MRLDLFENGVRASSKDRPTLHRRRRCRAATLGIAPKSGAVPRFDLTADDLANVPALMWRGTGLAPPKESPPFNRLNQSEAAPPPALSASGPEA